MSNAQDLGFVQQATASGLAEVTEGQIAVAKSVNPAVRSFGQQMVTDHTAANNQLRTIAAQEHIPQSPVLTAPEQQEKCSAPDFTGTYVDMQLVDHIQTLRQFLQETKAGQDPALVTFAQQQVPTLMQHLDNAAALDLALRGLPPTPATINASYRVWPRTCREAVRRLRPLRALRR